MKLISVIISAFNEEDCIDSLAERLKNIFTQKKLQYRFEVILVDNGSIDKTFEKMIVINKKYSEFKIVQLTRNFTVFGGLTAGLHYATGDAAITMYADLEDPPELILSFIEKWEQGYDNVYGITKERQGSLIRNINSRLFYSGMNFLSGGLIPKNVADYRLMDKKVYIALNNMPEKKRFLRGMVAWTGFNSYGIEYDRSPRYAGYSKASTLAVLRLAIEAIFSFSYVPIRLISGLGISLSLISFASLITIFINYLFFAGPFKGFATLLCSLFLLFGFLFCILGVLGEYIKMIYEEVKGRPAFIVNKVIDLE